MRNKTPRIIAEMLRENTGAHFLDSGCAYGRHYERNAHVKSFAQQPEGSLELYGSELCITLNVYHYLLDRLDYCAPLDGELRKFGTERPEDNWPNIMQEFAATFPDSHWRAWLSCNGEDWLSQSIRVVEFQHTQYDAVALVQLHGGCDIRGGYTTPRAFRCDPEGGLACDIAQADLFCSAKPHPHLWCAEPGRLTLLKDNDWQVVQANFTQGDSDIDVRCPFDGSKMKAAPVSASW